MKKNFKLPKWAKYMLIAVNGTAISIAIVLIYVLPNELDNIEKEFFGKASSPNIMICGEVIENPENFEQSFRKRTRDKAMAGTRPIKFYLASLITSDNEISFFLGKDSGDNHLYWIYEFEEPNYKSHLAFMRLDVALERNDCKSVDGSWVVETFIEHKFK